MIHVPIIGLHGCYCHPFRNWKECELMHKQKLNKGQLVKNRHTGDCGSIYEVLEIKFWYIVKYGDLQSDLRLEHSANIIKI